jgi:hypothetical protein
LWGPGAVFLKRAPGRRRQSDLFFLPIFLIRGNYKLKLPEHGFILKENNHYKMRVPIFENWVKEFGEVV